jgi:hypothetical protein
MALNLLRNTRVFFTTNVSATTGVVAGTGFTTSNTYEIQALDGFSFTQATTSETVTLNEAGSAPSRGQRSFNTALDPVEFNISTYIRPKFVDQETDQILAEERWLWNAFSSIANIGSAGAGWTTGTASSVVSFANSNAHQLQKFGMILVVDGAIYIIDNCAMDQAVIDFGIDSIATISWTGRGTTLRNLENITISTDGSGNTTFTGTGLAGTATKKDTTAGYLANKLSTVSISAGIGGGGTSYSLPITGGSITFANNLTYLTPANLGVVNVPITYFAGTRAVSGTLTAYLRTGGTNDSGDLLKDLLAGSLSNIEPGFSITVAIGGSTNANRVEISMPAAVLQIPTVNAEQVVSTTINFTAQGKATGTAYDIEAANEATITYYAA